MFSSAFWIQPDLVFSEDPAHCLQDLRPFFARLWELVFRKLQQRTYFPDAHTEIGKAHPEKLLLSLLHIRQQLRGQRHAGLNARGKAGIGGLVGCKEPRLPRQAADVRFCQAAFPQRRTNAQFPQCPHPRPVAGIIGRVCPVDHQRISVFFRCFPYLGEYHGLTVVTAVRRVGTDGRIPQNIEGQYFQPETELFADGFCIRKFKRSPALIANYAYNLVKLYNQFYQATPILREENNSLKLFRIQLSRVVARYIAHAMSLLGIAVPEKM